VLLLTADTQKDRTHPLPQVVLTSLHQRPLPKRHHYLPMRYLLNAERLG